MAVVPLVVCVVVFYVGVFIFEHIGVLKNFRCKYVCEGWVRGVEKSASSSGRIVIVLYINRFC